MLNAVSALQPVRCCRPRRLVAFGYKGSTKRLVPPLVFVFVVVGGLTATPAFASTRVAAARSGTARVGVLHLQYPDRYQQLDVARGVLVADYPLSRDSPTVRIGVFPPSGVVFELFREPKLQPPVPAPHARFPLSLTALGPSHQRPNGQIRELRFQRHGGVYWVIVWFGNRASADDRAQITAVVSSIRSS